MNETVPKGNRGIEHQGTKEKFWFGENQDKLFKIGKHKGENWAEIVAFSLATLLDIPCAKYTPASDDTQVKHGVISQSFINKKKGQRLINANELLAKLIKDYDPDKAYKQRKYTFHLSMALIKLLPLEEGAIKQFIGYLVFDVWIGNQDRHHENWGFVALDTKFYLAPSFDHASSMGCRVGDTEKQERLNTKDTGYNVEAFSRKAKTAMYDANNGKILKTYELSELCCKHYPEEYRFWAEKITQISEQSMVKCFDEVPENWMSDMDKKFTIKLLQANQKQLRKLCVKN
ncbi:HipA domain-containing protein [Bathymodiolus thermophilus thioautotrophic gill symbiont]|uniref:HipA-like C-terminal domain-containing protein n=1 Tax=Bathymodiolus thermophilus thioautotrophic gill symbiont TaxID=2360 RepID=A0A1J5UJ68_9GAMM|nr:HipA domain-containing protein [Bathymodiolus thermophilus thioautotrophic gill symbiont]OIR24303.1 hypothetical protein BGC33_10080 [Bathymodiolus thermophilus thioautotrophic gill symbiont]